MIDSELMNCEVMYQAVNQVVDHAEKNFYVQFHSQIADEVLLLMRWLLLNVHLLLG